MISAHETYARLRAERDALRVAVAEAHRQRTEATAALKEIDPKVKAAGLARVAAERAGVPVFVGPVAKAAEMRDVAIVEATEKHRIALSVGKAREDYRRELGFCLRDLKRGLHPEANEARAMLLRSAGIEPADVPEPRPPKAPRPPEITLDVMAEAISILFGKPPASPSPEARALAVRLREGDRSLPVEFIEAIPSDDQDLRCPYCHDSIDPEAVTSASCLTCGAAHHTTCWTELERCASCPSPPKAGD